MSKLSKESKEVKPLYTVDKYGLLVNVAMSEKDELIVRRLLDVVNNKGKEKNDNWPKSPNGMPWCESC